MRRFRYCLLPMLAVAALAPGNAAAEPDAAVAQEFRPDVRLGEDAGQKIRPADSGVSLNLHVFGLSYHPDREGPRVSHLDNEVNAGLGLNYEFRNDATGVTSLEAGFFKDSGREWAKFAGATYQFKFGSRWLVGADLLALQSPTYNHGRAFVAPIPHLTYDFGVVKVNGTYIPKYQEFNRYAVFAVYLTIPLRKW